VQYCANNGEKDTVDGKIIVRIAIDDTKLVPALEPNFCYKAIVGGPAPDFCQLPWPEGIADKGYSTADLMDAILKQYASDIEPPNICKLAVLVMPRNNGNTPTLIVLKIHVGHAGPEFNQEMVACGRAPQVLVAFGWHRWCSQGHAVEECVAREISAWGNQLDCYHGQLSPSQVSELGRFIGVKCEILRPRSRGPRRLP
jgi:hypothetical protein